MRTTLKSRLGRAAAENGNGHGGLPPVPLPRDHDLPAARAVRRKTQASLALKILGWAAVVVLDVRRRDRRRLVPLRARVHRDVGSASRPASRKPHTQLKVPVAGQPATALVIGYDHRANEAKGTPSRSDTLMLIRADPRSKTISLLSLPRDLQAEIRCPGKSSYVGKINSAYTYCGPQGTLQTVRGLTNLDINYLITVDFHGFKQIVDRLGGIYLDVDRRYLNTHPVRTATRRSICSPGTSCSPGSRHSTSFASATRTPTSTGSHASSSS